VWNSERKRVGEMESPLESTFLYGTTTTNVLNTLQYIGWVSSVKRRVELFKSCHVATANCRDLQNATMLLK
jgi:hypothetical protein